MRGPQVRQGGCSVNAPRNRLKQRPALAEAAQLVGAQGKEEKVLQRPTWASPKRKISHRGSQSGEASIHGHACPPEGDLGTGKGARNTFASSPEPQNLTEGEDGPLDGVGEVDPKAHHGHRQGVRAEGCQEPIKYFNGQTAWRPPDGGGGGRTEGTHALIGDRLHRGAIKRGGHTTSRSDLASPAEGNWDLAGSHKLVIPGAVTRVR